MFFEIEKPNRPTAVSAVLTAAIFDVENVSVSFALIRLEIIEHTVIVTVTAFAAEIGRPKSLLIAGHAAPKSESGIPCRSARESCHPRVLSLLHVPD